jgi:hypothetical protein
MVRTREPAVTSGLIEAVVRCAACEYDLRGLEASGACPECGRPITESLRGHRLQFSHARQVARMRVGALLVGLGLAILLIGWTAHDFAMQSILAPHLAMPQIYTLTAAFSMAGRWLSPYLVTVGWLLFAQRDPLLAEPIWFRAWRELSRVTSIIGVQAYFVWRFSTEVWRVHAQHVRWLSIDLPQVAEFTMWTCAIVFLATAPPYALIIARRLAMTWTPRLLTWFYPVLMVAIAMLVFGRAPLVRPTAAWQQSREVTVAGVGIVILVVCLGVLTGTMSRIATKLGFAATTARDLAAWRAAPRRSAPPASAGQDDDRRAERRSEARQRHMARAATEHDDDHGG